MGEVEIRALQQNIWAVLGRAASGEELTITGRGRPVAHLTGIPARRLHQLVAEGRARPARRSLAAQRDAERSQAG